MRDLQKSLWVWNLNEGELPNLISLCKRKQIDKVYLNYLIDIDLNELAKNGIEYSCLIGDSKNELNAQEIIQIAKKAFLRGFKRVHLDIEYSGTETKESYYLKLREAVSTIKWIGIPIEFDIECWNNDKEYLKIQKIPNELALMSYAKTVKGTIKRAGFFRFKPFLVGIETNPEYEAAMSLDKVDKAIEELNRYYRWNPFYRGVAIHCWGFYK